MNIRQWAMSLTGLEDDLWTALQFDNAVQWFGTYIENRLNETDPKGRPKYTLEQLLAQPKPITPEQRRANMANWINDLSKIKGVRYRSVQQKPN